MSQNTTRANYSNDTLTFTLPAFQIGDEIYVTFDAGVLYSNNNVSSPAQTDRYFLYFKVVDVQATTMFPYTSMGTTQSASTATSMSYNNTSAYTTYNPTVQISSTPAAVMNTGRKSNM